MEATVVFNPIYFCVHNMPKAEEKSVVLGYILEKDVVTRKELIQKFKDSSLVDKTIELAKRLKWIVPKSYVITYKVIEKSYSASNKSKYSEVFEYMYHQEEFTWSKIVSHFSGKYDKYQLRNILTRMINKGLVIGRTEDSQTYFVKAEIVKREDACGRTLLMNYSTSTYYEYLLEYIIKSKADVFSIREIMNNFPEYDYYDVNSFIVSLVNHGATKKWKRISRDLYMVTDKPKEAPQLFYQDVENRIFEYILSLRCVFTPTKVARWLNEYNSSKYSTEIKYVIQKARQFGFIRSVSRGRYEVVENNQHKCSMVKEIILAKKDWFSVEDIRNEVDFMGQGGIRYTIQSLVTEGVLEVKRRDTYYSKLIDKVIVSKDM